MFGLISFQKTIKIALRENMWYPNAGTTTPCKIYFLSSLKAEASIASFHQTSTLIL